MKRGRLIGLERRAFARQGGFSWMGGNLWEGEVSWIGRYYWGRRIELDWKYK